MEEEQKQGKPIFERNYGIDFCFSWNYCTEITFKLEQCLFFINVIYIKAKQSHQYFYKRDAENVFACLQLRSCKNPSSCPFI